MKKQPGIVYLLHFHRTIGSNNPRGQARHYLGWTTNLESRLTEHANGRGAAIMAYLSQAGIGWRLVRTWKGTRDSERKLKNRKKARTFCPLCQQEKQEKRK